MELKGIKIAYFNMITKFKHIYLLHKYYSQ